MRHTYSGRQSTHAESDQGVPGAPNLRDGCTEITQTSVHNRVLVARDRPRRRAPKSGHVACPHAASSHTWPSSTLLRPRDAICRKFAETRRGAGTGVGGSRLRMRRRRISSHRDASARRPQPSSRSVAVVVLLLPRHRPRVRPVRALLLPLLPPLVRAHRVRPALELGALRLLIAIVVLALVPRVVVPARQRAGRRTSVCLWPGSKHEETGPIRATRMRGAPWGEAHM